MTIYIPDITKKESVEQYADKIVALHDYVDGIINNAGIIQPFIKINDLCYEAITFTTMPYYKENSPLLPSGLLGPVKVISININK